MLMRFLINISIQSIRKRNNDRPIMQQTTMLDKVLNNGMFFLPAGHYNCDKFLLHST